MDIRFVARRQSHMATTLVGNHHKSESEDDKLPLVVEGLVSAHKIFEIVGMPEWVGSVRWERFAAVHRLMRHTRELQSFATLDEDMQGLRADMLTAHVVVAVALFDDFDDIAARRNEASRVPVGMGHTLPRRCYFHYCWFGNSVPKAEPLSGAHSAHNDVLDELGWTAVAKD